MEKEKEAAGSPTEQKRRDVAYAMVRGQMPLDEVLKQFGVSETEFTGWVLDGNFTEYAASLARGYAEADVAYVWKILQGLVREGGVSAIRLYFDLIGKKPLTNGAEHSGTGTGWNDLTGLRESIFNREKGSE